MPAPAAPRFIAVGCCGTVVTAPPVLDPQGRQLVEIALDAVAPAPRTPPSWFARLLHRTPRSGPPDRSRIT